MPNGLRRFVRVTSVLAGVVGLITLTIDLTAPTYSWIQGSSSGQASLLQVGVDPLTAMYMVLAALVCVALVLSGWGLRRGAPPLLMLGVVVSGIALPVTSVFGGWFIGPSLFPAAGVALIAAFAGSVLAVLSFQRMRTSSG
jgi:hypothetical protein